MGEGVLYIVPTPIGNLDDLTARALQTLQSVDLIACEDTRRTLGLLRHLGLAKTLWSFHGHSPESRRLKILEAVEGGKSVALVSDAGTPAISDPGQPLVTEAIERGLRVVTLPGPCAAIAALAGSGLPTDRFFFIGFLPRRPSRARRALAGALATGATVVVYESPYRALDTLQWVQDIGGPAVQTAVARELTKIHEEFVRGPVGDVIDRLKDRTIKGEVVLLFHQPELPENEEPE